jgi:hypothetical protein
MPFSIGGMTLIPDPAATKQSTGTAQVVEKTTVSVPRDPLARV